MASVHYNANRNVTSIRVVEVKELKSVTSRGLGFVVGRHSN